MHGLKANVVCWQHNWFFDLKSVIFCSDVSNRVQVFICLLDWISSGAYINSRYLLTCWWEKTSVFTSSTLTSDFQHLYQYKQWCPKTSHHSTGTSTDLWLSTHYQSHPTAKVVLCSFAKSVCKTTFLMMSYFCHYIVLWCMKHTYTMLSSQGTKTDHRCWQSVNILLVIT